MATGLVQIEHDREIAERLAAERLRLRKLAGLEAPKHFHKPIERAFTAEERSRVTILFGGLTWKHEELIRAVFLGTRLPLRARALSPTLPGFSSAKSTETTASAIPPTSPSATW